MRLNHLPDAAATRLAEGGTGWDLNNYLTAHLFQATAGEEHPWLPKTENHVTAEHTKIIAAAKRRRAERQQAIAEGRIT